MTTIDFDKKLICGPEYVAVRIIDNCEELKAGNIWLPQSVGNNSRLAFAKIENVGSKAVEEYGLKAGDYVLIDRLSTFAHTAPVAALKYNNVICKTNEDTTDFWPLKNMVFVEPIKKDSMSKINNIYVPSSYDDKLNIGIITKMNCEKDLNLPFNVEDKVLLSSGADDVKLGDKNIRIYKYDMIVATIKD